MATLVIPVDPKVCDIFGTANIPEFVSINGTNGPVSGYAFDAATMEQVFVKLTAWDYLSGNVSVTLRWNSRDGVTTNAVVWGAQLAAITPGDAQSVLTKAFATAATTTTTVNGTARGDTETIITVTAVDSVAAGDDVWLRVYRDAAAGGDTMTGDAVLFGINVGYAANSGGGSGDVTGPAGATDNAVCRFDLTTGKVIQDSGLLVDDSENITGAGTYNGVTVDKHDIIGELASDVALTTGTTLQNVTGLSIALPRAGTYRVSGALTVDASATITVAWGLNVSANFTRMAIGYIVPVGNTTQTTGSQLASLSAGGTGVASVSRTATTDEPTWFDGSITVSGAATIQLLASRSTGTITVRAGSRMEAREL